MYFKTTKEEDNSKVINLTNKQIFKLSVKFNKYNEKLERRIIDFKVYIEFLVSRNKIIGEEIANIKNQSLKSKNVKYVFC